MTTTSQTKSADADPAHAVDTAAFTPARHWLRAHPDVAATARGRVAPAGKPFPDAVLTAPALLAQLYREVTLEALRRDAPLGVTEQLLSDMRRMQAGVRRLEDKDFLREQLAALEGLRSVDEMEPVLTTALSSATEAADRDSLRRMLNLVRSASAGDGTTRREPIRPLPTRPPEPVAPTEPELSEAELQAALFGEGVGSEVGSLFDVPGAVEAGMTQGREQAITYFNQLGGASAGSGGGLFASIGALVGAAVGGALGGPWGAGVGASIGTRLGTLVDHEIGTGPTGPDETICDVCPDLRAGELCMPCTLIADALVH